MILRQPRFVRRGKSSFREKSQMARNARNHPAEIFGYPPANKSDAAQAHQQHWCPFVDKVCNKQSRLID
jgi:hypothetical protein